MNFRKRRIAWSVGCVIGVAATTRESLRTVLSPAFFTRDNGLNPAFE
jgi:hypothetical protein